MSTIANITVALSADISNFISGTKKSATAINDLMRAANKATTEGLSPLQRYEAAMDLLGTKLWEGQAAVLAYDKVTKFLAETLAKETAAVNAAAEATARLRAKQEATLQVAVAMMAQMGQGRWNSWEAGLANISNATLAAEARTKALSAAATAMMAQMSKGSWNSWEAGLANIANATAAAEARTKALSAAVTTMMAQMGQGRWSSWAAGLANITNATNAAAAANQRLATVVVPMMAQMGQGRWNSWAAGLANITNATAAAKARMDDVSNAGRGGFRMIASAISPTIGQMASFGVGVGAAILAINEFKNAMSAIVSTGVNLMVTFENVEVSLSTMYKSAGKGKAVLEELKDLAAKTPMEFPEIARSAKSLAAVGIEARDLQGHLKLMTELAAGSGTSIEELTRIYTRNLIQGRQYTRDINEFSNAGIPIWTQLSKVMKVSNDEVHQMVTDGRIGAHEFQMALIELVDAGGRWHGASEAAQKSTQGLMATLKDYTGFILEGMTKATAEALHFKDVIGGINQSMARERDVWQTTTADAFGFFDVFGAGLGSFLRFNETQKKIAALQKMDAQERLDYDAAKKANDHDEMDRAAKKIRQIQLMIALHQGEMLSAQDVKLLAERGKEELPTPFKGGDAAARAELEKNKESFDKLHDAMIKAWDAARFGKEAMDRLAYANAAIAAGNRTSIGEIMGHYDMVVAETKAAEERTKAEKDADAERKRHTETYDKLILSLKLKIALLDKDAEAERAAQLAAEGNNETEVRRILLLEKQFRVRKEMLDAQKEAADKNKKDFDDMKRRADELKKSLETPEAAQQRKEKELDKLFDKGLLTPDERDALQNKIDLEMQEALERDKKKTFGPAAKAFTPAAEFGSKEAYSIMVRAMGGFGGKNEAEKQRKRIIEELRQANIENRRRHNENRQPKVINIAGGGVF
jgi:tape measure domain-containing protein